MESASNLIELDSERQKRGLVITRPEEPTSEPESLAQVIYFRDIQLPPDVSAQLRKFKRAFPDLFKPENWPMIRAVEYTRVVMMKAIPELGLGMIRMRVPPKMNPNAYHQLGNYIHGRNEQQDVDDLGDYLSLEFLGIAPIRPPEISLAKVQTELNFDTGTYHPIGYKYPALKNLCPSLIRNRGLMQRLLNARKLMLRQKQKIRLKWIDFNIRSNDPTSYLDEIRNALHFLDEQEGTTIGRHFKIKGATERWKRPVTMMSNDEFEGLCERTIFADQIAKVSKNQGSSQDETSIHIRTRDFGRLITQTQQAGVIGASLSDEALRSDTVSIEDYLEESCGVNIVRPK